MKIYFSMTPEERDSTIHTLIDNGYPESILDLFTESVELNGSCLFAYSNAALNSFFVEIDQATSITILNMLFGTYDLLNNISSQEMIEFITGLLSKDLKSRIVNYSHGMDIYQLTMDSIFMPVIKRPLED